MAGNKMVMAMIVGCLESDGWPMIVEEFSFGKSKDGDWKSGLN
jgi:hypothetical protein